MADNSELEFRKFTFADTEKLSETYELCFGAKVDDRYFQWKYADNPAGEVVAFVAEAPDKTIAAYYGVLPEIYLVNGQPKKIYQSMDTMTHPNFQRRGLFGLLAKKTYEYVAETEGEEKFVGIPGLTSYPGFVKKLEWTDIHQFKYFFTNKILFKAAGLLRRTKKANFEKVAEMNQNLSEFFKERKVSKKPIQPNITADFFNWRVFQNPLKNFQTIQIKDGSGKIIGVCVFTIDAENRCFIHFLSFADSEQCGEYASAAIEHLFAETGAQFIYTWEPLEETLHRSLKKLGFVTNPLDKGLFSYHVPLIVRAVPKDTDGTNWYDVKNFDVQPLMQD